MKNRLIACLLLIGAGTSFGQTESDSLKLDTLRTESGVDPTRIQSRVTYSFLIYDQEGSAGQIINRAALNLGVNRWTFNMKYEVITQTTGEAGSGFSTGFGDIKFAILKAFYAEGKHALAGSMEFSIPTGKPGFGNQYLSLKPAITYSYTLRPGLFLAAQPQYTFDLMKDPARPSLSVITVRSFMAKFFNNGYFFVLEPRPVFDLTNNTFELIVSPILGKSLGGGFNFICLVEYPTDATTRKKRGVLYQFGFNKNF